MFSAHRRNDDAEIHRSDIGLVSRPSFSSKGNSQTFTLNLTPLKNFAAEKLGRHSALRILRDVILEEKDAIGPAEFLARLPVWLALLRRAQEEHG
jgi:hypothetical protein